MLTRVLVPTTIDRAVVLFRQVWHPVMPNGFKFAAGSKMILALWLGTATLTLTACGKKGPAAPSAVQVSTVTVKPQAATVAENYVAQTEAVNTVEIRPRVGGVLEKQLPIEGERLKVGELLFVIDQQPYIAALAQAKAALAQSEAALVQSQRDLARAKSLSEIDAVSQQELDAAVAKNDANLRLGRRQPGRRQDRHAEPGLHHHHQPHRWCRWAARSCASAALVTANTTLLTTLYQTDRMYVNFSISEQRLLTLQRELGRAPEPEELHAAAVPRLSRRRLRISAAPPAELHRSGRGSAHRHPGDPPGGGQSTASAARRAVRAGAGRDGAADPDAIVLPQRAIQDLQGKNYVWIVDAEGKAQQRDVQMGPRIGNDWQVQQGLKAGDVVVVDGVQRLKPGSPVQRARHSRTLPRQAAQRPGAARDQLLHRSSDFLDGPRHHHHARRRASRSQRCRSPASRRSRRRPSSSRPLSRAPTPPPSSSPSLRRSRSRSTACRT